MVRDEELNRLVRYAQGMGLSVRFKPYIKRSKTDAEWIVSSNGEASVVIYVSDSDSKLSKILSLIHEIAHHKDYVNRDRSFDDVPADGDEQKRARAKILAYEKRGTKYWVDIYNDTNCRFDIKKLYKQMELDIWAYEVYYETSKYPTRVEKREKHAQLKEKYGV